MRKSAGIKLEAFFIFASVLNHGPILSKITKNFEDKSANDELHVITEE